jgi:ribosomal protein S18 acetylase RimI-like enzyme
MKIRLLEKSDIRAAAAIVGQNYSERYKRSATAELRSMFGNAAIKPKYFVAEKEKAVIGFAGYTQAWMDYSIYEIFWVNVRPEFQRRGVGKLLIAELIEDIRKQKGARTILLTADFLKQLPDYYQRGFGFRTILSFGVNYRLMALMLK